MASPHEYLYERCGDLRGAVITYRHLVVEGRGSSTAKIAAQLALLTAVTRVEGAAEDLRLELVNALESRPTTDESQTVLFGQ